MTILTQTRLLNSTEQFSFSEVTWQCFLTEIMFLEVEMDKNILSSLILLNDSEKKISFDDNFHFENMKFNEKKSKRMRGIQNERKRAIIRNMKGKPILHLHHTQHKTPGFRVPLKPSPVQNPKVEVEVENKSNENNENNNEKSEKSENNESGSKLNEVDNNKKEEDRKYENDNYGTKYYDEEDIEEIIENTQARLLANTMTMEMKQKMKMKMKLRMTNELDKDDDVIEKLIHRIIRFSCHENLVDFLEALCTYVPSLKGSEIDNYFHYCGV